MRVSRQALRLLALPHVVYGLSLPYNPTRLFLATNSTTLYKFQPSPQTPNQAQLLTLDLKDSIASSSLPWSSISESLPFLQDDEQLPYTPSVEADESITVITGNCSEGASGMQIWRYASTTGHGDKDGSWSQSRVSDQERGSNSGLAGSNYLASSIAFSQYVDSTPASTDIFAFGGMCPTPGASLDTWVNSADYSNLMLTLSADTAKADATNYKLSVAESRGPPIPQAGVSITPLPPTYPMSTDGQPQTQQQNFVLLGGHTQAAFINMSQVAVFSLPQQSWSFMPVSQPSNTKMDLAIRQDSQVTPRSGHTAVLSDKGDSIILFGGWVGDVSTPATPQLAVLELGSGYGGSGDWKWNTRQLSGNNLATGAGIYGHGAVMLPGGVMMISGGYEIPSTTSKRTKRDLQSASSHTMFYNTTSHSWIQSYTLPAEYARLSNTSSGPLSRISQKVGLGTGLGIGAAMLLSVVIFYFWYSKRLKHVREDRERTLMISSSDGSSIGYISRPFLDDAGVDGRSGDGFGLGRFWPTGGQAGTTHLDPPQMQHTTGVWVDKPSPTRGLRKGVASKNYQYHAAPHYDEKRLSRASGHIHPIAEHENEDDMETASRHSVRSDQEILSDAEAKLREVERVLNSVDPFQDVEPNPLGSHPVSPSDTNTLRRVPTGNSRMSIFAKAPANVQDLANWSAEPGAEDETLEQHGGRVSPSKSDDRTSSTLSEQSHRSTTSNSSVTRTMSTRTGAVLAAAAAARRQAARRQTSPTEERTQTMSTDGGSIAPSIFQTRKRSSTCESYTPGAIDMVSEGDSFMTARSNFVELQNEGEALLGGRPVMDKDDPYQRALAAHTSTQTRLPPHYRPVPPSLQSRPRQGLMGSLRRALNAVSMSDRSLSLTSSVEQYKDDPRSSSSSPTKARPRRTGNSPQRAVSDGAALLRQKRGQMDWEEKDWAPYRDNPDTDDWGTPKPIVDKEQAEADWDVEEAASKRDFQVMFTVPKSRLRVVNDDMDRASLRSASDGAVSRNGSVKTVQRVASVKTLRARSEGQNPWLPSTEEEMDENEKDKAA